MARRSTVEKVWGRNLGPLIPIAPEKLVRGERYDAMDGFFLALALVFNDLKGLVFGAWLLKTAGQAQDYTAAAGQYSGLLVQLNRYVCGVVHELFCLLEEHEKKKLFVTSEFQEFEARLPKAIRPNWLALRGEAGATTPLTVALLKIRNGGAFHYYKPKLLARGFRSHFAQDSPASDAALFSFGRDMEATRFYFADAAANALVDNVLKQEEITFEEVDAAVREANQVLASVLATHLNMRNGGPFQRPPGASLQRAQPERRNEHKRRRKARKA